MLGGCESVRREAVRGIAIRALGSGGMTRMPRVGRLMTGGVGVGLSGVGPGRWEWRDGARGLGAFILVRRDCGGGVVLV